MPDNLSVTVAEYRTGDRSWRIDGTSDVVGPGVKVTIKIVIHLIQHGKVLGTATVDNAGIWRFRSTNSNLATLQGGTLTVESTSGGKLTKQPVTIRN